MKWVAPAQKRIIQFTLLACLTSSPHFLVHTHTDALDQHTENLPTKQTPTQCQKEELKLDTTPVRREPFIPYHFFSGVRHFTQSGVKCFLKHTFNHPRYHEIFLPYNLSHLLKCLTFAPKSTQSTRYCATVFDLFMLKIMQTPCINAHAFQLFLSQLKPLLQKVCDEGQQIASLEAAIERKLYRFYLKRFDAVKEDPQAEIKKQSQSLAALFTQHESNNIALQQSAYTFCLLAVRQLLWSAEDAKKLWKSVKDIADELMNLYKMGILPSERHLDDLYWALINQYCYVLTLAGPHIEQEHFEVMAKDITENEHPLWSLTEREQYITKKKAALEHAIMHGLIVHAAVQEKLIADRV